MNQQRAKLIQDLSQQLSPVARPGRVAGRVFGWLAISTLFVIAAMSLQAPFRAGWLEQLLGSPQFLAESLLGLFAIVGLGGVIFKLGIPAYPRVATHTVIALLLLSSWVGFYLFGLQHPAFELSMHGKREGCYLQVFLFSIPPVLAAAYLLRGLVVTRPVWVGVLSGICAGAIPGLLMQIGCMYIPEHILTHHIAPIAGSMLLGAGCSWLVLRRA